MSKTSSQRAALMIACAAILFWLLTAWVNIGFVALDDYSDMLLSSIPAQTSTAAQVIQNSGIRSPLPRLTLFTFAQTAFALGADNPVTQIRISYALIGILCGLSLLFGWKTFRLLKQKKCAVIFLCLMGFHFVSPYLFTRALIESLAAPFLMMSAYFLCDYHLHSHRRSLILSCIFVTIASLFRFQAGVCIIGIIAIMMMNKKYKDLWVFAVAALGCFALTGALDWWLRGRFHDSLIRYVSYNAANSSAFGKSPWPNYIYLFIGLSIPPVFFSRYKGLRWRSEYHHLLPIIYYFVLFVLAHTVVPHKEPRFMATVLPLFFILLTPLARHLLEHKQKWRLAVFTALNVPLLFLTSFSIAQNNVIGAMRYLDEHPHIKMIINVNQSIVLPPLIYTLQRPQLKEVNQINENDFETCSDILAVREDLLEKHRFEISSLKLLDKFSPGPLEKLIIRLQPAHNLRRDTIYFFGKAGCEH